MMTLRKKRISALMLMGGLLAGLLPCGLQPAMGQVVNSGPSSSRATSQVTLTATVPEVVVIQVDPSRSVLSATISPTAIGATGSVPSNDFRIMGNLIVNNASSNVQCTVSGLTLVLKNGGAQINAQIKGTIGATPISTQNFQPKFTNRIAAIDIIGDLDETTLTTSLAPGSYAGTLTITASLL